MQLRNWKETVPPTIEETLMDVHPLTLDEKWHWVVKENERVWIKTADGKWRRGRMFHEWHTEYTEKGRIIQYFVHYGKPKKEEIFAPMLGNMKPDTPEMHELLRRAGVPL